MPRMACSGRSPLGGGGMPRERRLIQTALAALVALWVSVLPMAVAAQAPAADLDSLARRGAFTRDRGMPVQERVHPEWDAPGLRFGELVAYPSIGLEAGSTNNLYATPAHVEGDGVFHLRPAVVVQADRPDRRVSAYALIDATAFAAHGAESTTDYALGAAVVAESPRSFGLEAGADFARKTEPRTSPDSPADARTPVRYDLAQGRLGLAAAFNRLRLSGRLVAADLAFDDVRSTSGVVLPQSFRDRTEVTGTLRGEYAIRPAASVFVAASFVDRSYRNQASALVDRSSSGARLEVGANFDSSRLVRGEVAVGYLQQDYQGRYATVSGASARARIDAFPTQLTTLSLTATRAVEDSVIPAAGGYLASTVKGEVHHELLRNLLLHASASYEEDGYRGVDRQDQRIMLGAGLRYLMNRGVVVTAQLEREVRHSAGLQRGLGYTVDRATVGLTLRC